MSTELKAGAALAALLLVAGVALALTAGDGKSGEGPRMTLERGTSPTGLGEVLVTVTGDAEVAGGATSVKLTCRDRSGRVVTSGRHEWPLQVDGPDPQPHIHQPVSGRELGRIERCVLGTRPAITATLPLR